MHNISFEESRKRFPVGIPGGVFVYRLHTEFSQFVMDVVEHIQERGLQRVVILVQKGVSKSVIDDVTQRIAELLESEKRTKQKKIALECLHGLTRTELRQLKRQWERSQKEYNEGDTNDAK